MQSFILSFESFNIIRFLNGSRDLSLFSIIEIRDNSEFNLLFFFTIPDWNHTHQQVLAFPNVNLF